MTKNLFTSESVTEGHPDKVCDQVSDAILDKMLEGDPESRVAVECLTKTGFIVVAGEVTTDTYVDIQDVARSTIQRIGYDDPNYGFDYETCGVLTSISEQSQDIARGVTETDYHEQGAGDQGIMSGYACNETDVLMPLPIMLAHRLSKQLAHVRKENIIDFLRPDGKSQVTIEYDNGKPIRADAIVVSSHHNPGIDYDEIRSSIIEEVIKPICGEWIDKDTQFHVNPTGKFVIGGPVADAGVTGRKIIVDTYGGVGSHGGGAFSGKDPTKVDRSASYMARHIAKHIIAAELADKCEVQLGYAIGVAEPVSVFVNTKGTGKIEQIEITKAVRDLFPLKPSEIIDYLDLKRPIYLDTAAYGHFGREEENFTWEKLNKLNELKNYFK
ncbi:MAG: methionine adenosyltransferase [Candidatus Marinimicrobia bacterium]|nr:methionine adenosyltransferase [Candidatus Neomarinimicrobiota bacterium]